MIPMATGGTRGWLRQYTGPLRPIYREVLVMSLFVNLLALAVPVPNAEASLNALVVVKGQRQTRS